MSLTKDLEVHISIGPWLFVGSSLIFPFVVNWTFPLSLLKYVLFLIALWFSVFLIRSIKKPILIFQRKGLMRLGFFGKYREKKYADITHVTFDTKLSNSVIIDFKNDGFEFVSPVGMRNFNDIVRFLNKQLRLKKSDKEIESLIRRARREATVVEGFFATLIFLLVLGKTLKALHIL